MNAASSRFRNRDGTIQQGVGRGLLFNTGSGHAGYVLGTSEPDTQEVFQRHLKPGMTAFDVGANVGFFSIIAARLVGRTGRVISFEPLPQNVRQIQYNARLNKFDHVTVRAEALGRDDGEATFQVSAVSSWGRLAGAGTVAEQIATMTVPVRRLDSAVQVGGLPPPQFMKIDVEGAEADVLRGAEQTLRTFRPVMMIELHGTNAVVSQVLEALNYEARVVGSDALVTEASWDAKVLCLPREAAR
jgi:FkbM family methyltransferase